MSVRRSLGWRGVLLLLGLLVSTGSAAQPPTSDTCTPAWRADWRDWIETRWHDPLAARLYALWVGLCQLVADGELTDQESHDLFRIASQRIIEQRAREWRGRGKGEGL